MKAVFISVFFVFALIEIAMATETTRLTVEVDTDKLRYRVCLHTQEDGLEYDALDLIPPDAGFSPRRVRGFLKDTSGKAIKCGNTDGGYSSYEMYSGSPVFESSFQKVPVSKILFSEWYSFQDLLRGFSTASGVNANHWGSLKLKFTVTIRRESQNQLSGESGWIELKKSQVAEIE